MEKEEYKMCLTERKEIKSICIKNLIKNVEKWIKMWKPEISTISTFPHSKLYRFLHSEKYCKIKENGIEKPQNKIIYPHLIHKMWINDRWIRV